MDFEVRYLLLLENLHILDGFVCDCAPFIKIMLWQINLILNDEHNYFKCISYLTTLLFFLCLLPQNFLS